MLSTTIDQHIKDVFPSLDKELQQLASLYSATLLGSSGELLSHNLYKKSMRTVAEKLLASFSF